ncbi:MAG: hypothetical protein MK207_10285 [Saprospiraceae bacterium]|nr:hypothetical protein [Saprospiraceae bacterium]
MIEIDNHSDFKNWINIDLKKLPAVAIQSLNLIKYENIIVEKEFEDSLFLGCTLNNNTSAHIVKTGGIVIPNSKKMLFKTHLSHLYNHHILFEGFDINNKQGYKSTLDYNIYKQYIDQGKDKPSSIYISLMRRLHDHSITDALEEVIEGRKVVAIMGGHNMERSDKFYWKIATISRELTQKGFLLVSGGGPGAMEATHLGAYFACRSLKEMKTAVEILSIRPKDAIKGQEYNDWDWLHRAFRVMEKYPITKKMENNSMSIGIPTWLYGHEPPTPFATHIAKYFANSVREDGLLAIAKHGVIFAPGSAGTTQEIFQDACQNHYAAYNSNPNIESYVSPMILFGVDHWTIKRPLWDLMVKISENRPYGKLLYLTDNENEILEKILNYNPNYFKYPA